MDRLDGMLAESDKFESVVEHRIDTEGRFG